MLPETAVQLASMSMCPAGSFCFTLPDIMHARWHASRYQRASGLLTSLRACHNTTLQSSYAVAEFYEPGDACAPVPAKAAAIPLDAALQSEIFVKRMLMCDRRRWQTS